MALLENLNVTVVWRLKVGCGFEALKFRIAVFEIGEQLQVPRVEDVGPDVVECSNFVVVQGRNVENVALAGQKRVRHLIGI